MSKNKSGELPPLSPGQLEVMEIIWDRGELSAYELREIISETRAISRNAIKTNLDRMQAKGWLCHRVIGRTHFYRAVVDREQGLGKRVLNLVDKVCGGDPKKLMMALLNSRKLSVKEIEQIQDLLDSEKKKRRKPGQSGRRRK